MNSKTIENDITLLKEDFNNLGLFKEYFELKKAIISSKILQNSDKKIILSKYLSLNQEDKKRYGFLKMRFKDNPLISNYFSIKSDIEDFVIEVNDLLNL